MVGNQDCDKVPIEKGGEALDDAIDEEDLEEEEEKDDDEDSIVDCEFVDSTNAPVIYRYTRSFAS